MISKKFDKLPSSFICPWNIDDIVGQFTKTLQIQNNNGQIHQELSGEPVWQKYPSGISFARNFYTAFRSECIQITELLTELQSKILVTPDKESQLLNIFLDHRFDPSKVNLIKIESGTSVQPHIDKNRSVCLNIGIKNSFTCDTFVGDEFIDNFWDTKPDKYTMNDGDIYILNVKKPHAVISNSLPNSNLDRYIITYTLAV